MKYKRTIIVEAIQYVGETVVAPKWIEEAFKNGILYHADDDEGSLHIVTGDDEYLVNEGDYIVRFESGRIFHYPKLLFEANYKKIEK